MRKVALALVALATLSFAAPAIAQVTSYSVSGAQASGSFTLSYDSGTSTYSLTSLNLVVGSNFDTSNAGLQPFGSDYLIGGNVAGLAGEAVGTNDFFFDFDPTAATQSKNVGFVLGGYATPGDFFNSNETITQTGSSGSTTDYSISGGPLAGTFTLDFDSGSSTYSLDALDLLLGDEFDLSNSGVQVFGTDLLLGGNVNGLTGETVGTSDFFFDFDPNAATQTKNMGFTLVGFDQPGQFFNADVTITQLGQAVSGVPEPSTWAMMLAGFAGMGIALRRTRRLAAA